MIIAYVTVTAGLRCPPEIGMLADNPINSPSAFPNAMAGKLPKFPPCNVPKVNCATDPFPIKVNKKVPMSSPL